MDEGIEKDDRTLHAVHRHRAYITPSYRCAAYTPQLRTAWRVREKRTSIKRKRGQK